MTITTTEQDNSPSVTETQTETYKLPNDYKRNNLTRSPSLEKIMKFNTYICSQNFFILPSILTWLRTSQTVLKAYAQKCIAITKAAIYSTVLYKVIEAQFRMIATTAFRDVSLSEPKRLLPALKVILTELRRSLENLSERVKRKILKATVYFSFFFIFLQLSLCLWSLSAAAVPFGLTFLLSCLTVISYANFQCLRFVIIEEILKEEARTTVTTHVSRRYIRRSDILGRRTISKVKLF